MIDYEMKYKKDLISLASNKLRFWQDFIEESNYFNLNLNHKKSIIILFVFFDRILVSRKSIFISCFNF